MNADKIAFSISPASVFVAGLRGRSRPVLVRLFATWGVPAPAMTR